MHDSRRDTPLLPHLKAPPFDAPRLAEPRITEGPHLDEPLPTDEEEGSVTAFVRWMPPILDPTDASRESAPLGDAATRILRDEIYAGRRRASRTPEDGTPLPTGTPTRPGVAERENRATDDGRERRPNVKRATSPLVDDDELDSSQTLLHLTQPPEDSFTALGPIAASHARLVLSTVRVEEGSPSSRQTLFLRAPDVLISRRPGARSSKKNRPDSDRIALGHGTVSSRHARLVFDGEGFFLEDLGSRHGTFVNGREIPKNQPTEIHSGDVLRFAAVDALFLLDRDPDGAPITHEDDEITIAKLRADGLLTASQVECVRTESHCDGRSLAEATILLGLVSATEWATARGEAREKRQDLVRRKKRRRSRLIDIAIILLSQLIILGVVRLAGWI